MEITLNRQEINKILKEKYGDGFFKCFYVESDKTWEQRNKKKTKDLKEPPKKEAYLLYFDN